MKTLHNLSCLLLLLFIGTSIQAQENLLTQQSQSIKVTEYHEKLNRLDALAAEQFQQEIKGMLPTMTISKASNSPMEYGNRVGNSIKRLELNNPNDFSKIVQTNPAIQRDVEIILINANQGNAIKNQNWLKNNHNIASVTRNNSAGILENLKYVYIQSYTSFSKNSIAADFGPLIQSLPNAADVEIIYETIQTAQ